MLESNRAFGQQICHEIGMLIANTQHFSDFDAAINLINKTSRRYVYKSNGANCECTRNYVGMAEMGLISLRCLGITKAKRQKKLKLLILY